MLLASHLLVLCCIFAAIALGLNLLVGRLGELTLHQAALFGIGAYSFAILTTTLTWSPYPAFIAAVTLTSATAFIIALCTQHLREEIFSLSTLAVQMIIFTLLYNWKSLTGASFGISQVPSLFRTESGPSATLDAVAPAVTSLVLAITITSLVARAPFGASLMALKEDELASITIGKNPLAIRRAAQALFGAICGFTGASFAAYIGYLHPSTFDLMNSTMLLSMVILGGSRTILGPVSGATALTLLPEVLRSFNLPSSSAAEIQRVLFGLALITFALLRPQGTRKSGDV